MVTKNQTFFKRTKSMLKADLRRLTHSPFVYIMTAVCFILPILFLVMTSFMPSTTIDKTTGLEKVNEKFTNVWEAFGALPSAVKDTSADNANSMSLISMCNINLLFFAVIVFVCIFVGADYKSGFVKNIFSVRGQKIDYVFSKTLLSFVVSAVFFIAYFIGAMIGGAISNLSFEIAGFGVSGIICCFVSKILLTSIFVSVSLLVGVIAKSRTWLSLLISIGAGALLFATIPLVTPLTSNLLNVVLCLVGSGLFTFGLGALSNVILKKTDIL